MILTTFKFIERAVFDYIFWHMKVKNHILDVTKKKRLLIYTVNSYCFSKQRPKMLCVEMYINKLVKKKSLKHINYIMKNKL